MQHRQTDIKGVYRQMVGGLTAEEIRRLGGFTRERAARLKRFMDGETPAEVAARPAPLPAFASRAPVEDQKVSWWKRDLSPRAIGFVLLFCGTGLGYLGFLLPWQQAQNQAPSISFSTKGAFVAVLSFGMGLPYALAPNWATRVLGHPQKLTALGYVFAAIACVAGAISVALFRELLREHGY